jgi:hypothetical protein
VSSLVAPLLDAPPLARLGLPELLKAESPAAGANFQYNVEGGFYERVLAISVRLVTSADAADRTLYVEYRDDADVRTGISGAPVTQSASTTTDYFFSAFLGQPDWAVAATVLVPLAPLLLLPTHDWRLVVDTIQATDALSRIRVWRERFYTTDTPSTLIPL